MTLTQRRTAHLERENALLRVSRDSLQRVCDDLRRQLRERDVIDLAPGATKRPPPRRAAGASRPR